jgi:hypothetical protein
MSDKELALKAAYESAKDRINISEADFIKMFGKDWEIIPVKVKHQIVGCMLRKGPELHAAIKPEGHKKWYRKAEKKVVEDTVKQFGYAVTAVMANNKEGQAFVTRLGFKQVATDGITIIYVLGNKDEPIH